MSNTVFNFLYCSKIHIKKFAILTNFKCTVQCTVKYIHIVVHHPSPELFSTCKTDTLYPLNNNFLFLPPPGPGNHSSTFCFYEFDYSRDLIKVYSGTSLVARWLRIRLPMQGTWVRALVWEDPTCHGTTKPMHHNYWACALEPASHNYWACVPQLLNPACLEPVVHNKRSHLNEKTAHHNEE